MRNLKSIGKVVRLERESNRMEECGIVGIKYSGEEHRRCSTAELDSNLLCNYYKPGTV